MVPKSLLITVRLSADEWALLRVSVICRFAMSKKRAERLAAAEPPATAAADYVKLEPKLCEICSTSFLRVIGEEEKLCSRCEGRLAATERDHAASLAAAKRDRSDKPRVPAA